MDEMVQRAMAAWFRAGGGSDQPIDSSSVRKIEGLKYVVLENSSGLLAVYRIKNDGILKRLKRWPKELEA